MTITSRYTDEMRLALIERRLITASHNQHVDWAQKYLSDVRFLADLLSNMQGQLKDEVAERLSLEKQLEIEHEATHFNFEEWQRSNDECAKLTAEIMALKKGKSSGTPR
jgi:hypothetical protein